MRYLPLVLSGGLLISLLLPGLLGPESRQAPDAVAIDTLVKDARRHWDVPGVAVAIVRNDEVIYLKGFGVRELGSDQTVTPDTLFPLASCTKSFTTTAMALLVDEGKMTWDDPVRKHVPYFRLADPLANAQVTLRDLITHRTGVGGHDLLWYRSPWTQEEIIRRVGLVQPDRPFRTTFLYQSTMFLTAGHAVAAAAKTSWADFVQQRLFDPLGMKSANFTTSAALKAPDHASPHRRDGQGRIGVIPWYPIEVPDPAGSINASARDLAQWLRFQLGDGTFAGKRLVSAANLKETHTPQIVQRLEGPAAALNPDTNLMSYGMGWVIQDYRGHQLVSHGGAIDGFRTHFTLVPREKLGLVLLNNLHRTHMNLALSNSLVDLLLGLPKKDWNAYVSGVVKKDQEEAARRVEERLSKRQHGTRPSRELSAYTGSYEEPAYGTVRVTLESGSLVWRWNSFTCPLHHFHFDTFLAQDEFLGHPDVAFTLGADGQVAGMRVGEVLNVEFRRAIDKR
jgi:CubicO group peptidase (beta-lactamase class C family)